MADTYQSIRCPACGNVMKKVFIPSVGVNIDICADGCGGIYFDAKILFSSPPSTYSIFAEGLSVHRMIPIGSLSSRSLTSAL